MSFRAARVFILQCDVPGCDMAFMANLEGQPPSVSRWSARQVVHEWAARDGWVYGPKHSDFCPNHNGKPQTEAVR